MNFKKVALLIILLFVSSGFAQITITEITAKETNHFICNVIGYPITGLYQFKGAEPIVELLENGTGYYQLHDQLKRPIVWGVECSESGGPKFIKGFDYSAYTLWYKYTDDENVEWISVELSVHFKSMKMYIQGERLKLYKEEK
ncbi:hypothetical protein OX283_003240 [Flavobacterium sp. SUN052]|uniref:hypothetical protein n=1 Tax=Flavobacterium sp. SUN052 TaxID=3002441 RepID=UPI00237E6033|nr:hypothetical protein [Flavobacterium sp. SUN052]MEC4003661.1 hypothetical protein [Flavobacterium sp. SUN052]